MKFYSLKCAVGNLANGKGRKGEGKGTWMEGERDGRGGEGEGRGKGREGEGREGGLCSSNISFKNPLRLTDSGLFH